MSARLLLLVVVIGLLGAVTVLALEEVGYFGIIEPHFKSFGQLQVLLDLVIACGLACVWMVQDARARGVRWWPFVVVTLLAGSFGPLLYLVTREVRASALAPGRAETRAH